MNDVIQYENDFIIQTKTRHRTPIVRTTSITNVDEPNRHKVDRARVARIKRASIKHLARTAVVEHESGSSSPDGEAGGLQMLVDSDSSPDDDGAYITQLLPIRTHAMLSPITQLDKYC